ncbi:MAG: tRNA (N6-threonylcarbamoyladenosine(37)-N6)-methyltransferase TrmO [Ruminococcaceae bacterium]|nr:tRNA (N6-threonylcarbamoyladenosine(37)-N6)-methyltransferase TrmO [Oscillospiraceae bacterium]
MQISPIAYVENDLEEKFGAPRQSGLASELRSMLVFEAEYSIPEAFRGLEDFGRIWLIWGFDRNENKGWSPTVRPPKLGGNKRLGVFATRSPFRPNAIGISCVKLESIEYNKDKRAVLTVLGADLVNGTPIFDIKPYIPYADCFPEEENLWADPKLHPQLEVILDERLESSLGEERARALKQIIACDPRPGYKDDGGEYRMSYGGKTVVFTVADSRASVREAE